MKIKKLICIVLTVAFALSAFQVFAFADNTEADYKEYVFESGVSDELKARVIAVINDEESEADPAGLLCDVLGHNFEATTVSEITHKAKTTAPRCLEKIYTVNICSRCDYATKTLNSSIYIYCCA